MSIESIGLAWIVVDDLKAAVKFYTEVVGLKVETQNDEFGWAELCGHKDGMKLGISAKNESQGIHAGTNAVVTLTVSDIEATKKEMLSKGAKMIGDIMEVPGHVKLQTFSDKDGNKMQLVQLLY